MKPRYLVTAIGGDIGSSVIHHLGEAIPRESLLGCDITPYVSGYGYAGEFFLMPPYTEEDRYIEALQRECKRRGITHILPMTEGEIILFDRHRHVWSLEGIKVMINKHSIIEIAMSKYHTAAAIKAIGLDSPQTWKVGEEAGKITYPVIVKPDRGCGSKKIRIVRNRLEYDMAAAEIPEAVAQEYIGTPEEEYTMGVFSDGVDVKSIIFKRRLGAGGMTCRAELVEDTEAGRIAETAAKALGLEGSINIQMRKKDGRYYIFEINPRISGTVGFRYLLGFKDILWWLDLMDGRKDRMEYAPVRLPAVGIRTFGEEIFL
ncbi:MAG: ATP-grasp domain-containing protein [Lachnospiraceae bacterium]|nr:ATP-grasp domain-containing protein [Lachnospiraceae bacterium]